MKISSKLHYYNQKFAMAQPARKSINAMVAYAIVNKYAYFYFGRFLRAGWPVQTFNYVTKTIILHKMKFWCMCHRTNFKTLKIRSFQSYNLQSQYFATACRLFLIIACQIIQLKFEELWLESNFMKLQSHNVKLKLYNC